MVLAVFGNLILTILILAGLTRTCVLAYRVAMPRFDEHPAGRAGRPQTFAYPAELRDHRGRHVRRPNPSN